MSATKREALARAMWQDTNDCPPGGWELEEPVTKSAYLSNVDALLAELREPDEGMLEAAQHWAVDEAGTAFWQAMIDHLMEKG